MTGFSLLRNAALVVSLGPIVLAGGTAAVFGEEAWKDWNVFSTGHTDLRTDYEPESDRWSMKIDRGDSGDPGTGDEILTPGRTILLVTDAAKRTLDSDPPEDFSFLGEEGDTYYRILTSEEEGVLFLGFNGYGVPTGTFEGDLGGEFYVELTDFAGAGEFFLYTGGPNMLMDTRQDPPPYGEKREFAGGHSHQNWVFREPGIHLLELTPHGTLASDGTVSTGDPTLFFVLVDPSPADWWRLDTFRENAKSPEAELTGDASGDGRPNLLAYALGYDPKGPAERYLPRPGIVESEGREHLSLVFRKPRGGGGTDDRSDLVYRVEAGVDLTEWEALEYGGDSAWEEIDPDYDGTRRVRAIDPEPLENHERRYMRLVVEWAPPDRDDQESVGGESR